MWGNFFRILVIKMFIALFHECLRFLGFEGFEKNPKHSLVNRA